MLGSDKSLNFYATSQTRALLGYFWQELFKKLPIKVGNQEWNIYNAFFYSPFSFQISKNLNQEHFRKTWEVQIFEKVYEKVINEF